jgi:hypothetical protein
MFDFIFIKYYKECTADCIAFNININNYKQSQNCEINSPTPDLEQRSSITFTYFPTIRP